MTIGNGKAPCIHTLVAGLVAGGYVDELDRDDVMREIVRWAEACGIIDRAQRLLLNTMANHERQRAIVAQYARVAKQTRNVHKRAAAIAQLGVNPSTLTHWARRHFGPGYLAGLGPPAAIYHIVDFLRREPGSTRKQIFAHSGVPHTSIPGAMDWGLKKGRLWREKRDKRSLYRWWATDVMGRAIR